MSPRDVNRIALALGVRSGEDYTVDELVDRANFLRQFCESRYRRNDCSVEDLEAASEGLEKPAVGRILAALNLVASEARESSTWPAPPPTPVPETQP